MNNVTDSKRNWNYNIISGEQDYNSRGGLNTGEDRNYEKQKVNYSYDTSQFQSASAMRAERNHDKIGAWDSKFGGNFGNGKHVDVWNYNRQIGDLNWNISNNRQARWNPLTGEVLPSYRNMQASEPMMNQPR